MRREIFLEDKTGRALIQGISGKGCTKYYRDDIVEELVNVIKNCISPIPPIDASCHIDICEQSRCARCQDIIAVHTALAKIEEGDV